MRWDRFWTRWVGMLLLCVVLVWARAPVRAAPPADVTAAGRTFFVAPGGRDSNPGTPARPWRTIGKAVRTLAPGDVVYIKNGVYREAIHLDWRNSGAPGRPIAYRAYPGHAPVLDGATVGTASLGLFQMIGANYIEISGLTIRDSRVAGIHVRDGQGITIKNNRIVRSKSSGIGIWRCSNVVVECNVLEDCRIDPEGHNEMLAIATTTDYRVAYNEIYWTDPDCCRGTSGIDVKNGSARGGVYSNYLHDLPTAGIYLDAWELATYDHEVAGNYITHARVGIAIGSERGGTLSDLRIYNNVIHYVRYAGIGIHDYAYDGLRRDIHIYHNTVVGSYGNGGAAILIASYNVRHIVLTNNLLNFGPDTCSGQIKAYLPWTITSVDNLVYGPKLPVDDPDLVEITRGTITVDPRFLDSAHSNFHLRANSPARDRGSPVDLDRDHDGVRRPIGSGYDIGAYEYRAIGPMNHRSYLMLVVR